MSILDKKLFNRTIFSGKKKKDDVNVKRTGVCVSELPVLEKSNRLYFILTNALINFLVVAGAAGSFVKPFNIKCYMPVVLITAFIIALLMAFFYYNNIVKSIGYIGCLIAFIYGAFNFRYLLKGGFGYISNNLMTFFEKELDLPVERSYDVYGYGEKFSVTICLIFIIFALMILFNMVISESKGFVLVFMITFPIVQLAMYFDRKISVIFFVMYMVGILGLFFLKNSNHSRMEYKKRKGYKAKKRKNKIIYDYTNDGKYSLNFIIVMGIVLIIAAIIVNIAYPQKDFVPDDKYSEWKQETLDFAKELIMVGFWGMISPNGGSAGGVGRNRLGQSKYVRLDYQTDLIVSMAQEKEENSLYLKAFNGAYYRDEFWETISEHYGEDKNTKSLEAYDLESDKAIELSSELASYYNSEKLFGVMKKVQVANVAATNGFVYAPYNVVGAAKMYEEIINDDEYVGNIEKNRYMTMWCTPIVFQGSVDEFRNEIANEKKTLETNAEKWNYTEAEDVLSEEKKYSEYVYDNYMDVPKKNRKAIKEFCEMYNLSADSDDIVGKVADIFEQDYEYTLMPGVTPSKEEFVNYFLGKSKKGYCVYFATSATLIFRYLGIPARYAGGYVLQAGDFMSGTSRNEKINEWVDGTLDYDTEVLEYEINDSQAHAWVEIYIDGYGWLPVETTPSSDEDIVEKPESEQNNALVNFITNTVLTKKTFDAVKNTTYRIVIFAIVCGITVIVIYVVVGICVRKRRKNYTSVIKSYGYMCKAVSNIKMIKGDTETYEDFGKRLVEAELAEIDKIIVLNKILEKDKFSGRDAVSDEIDIFNNIVYEIVRNVYDRLSVYKRFIFKYIKWL